MKSLKAIIISVSFLISTSFAVAEENQKLTPEEMGNYLEVMLVKMMEVYASPKMVEKQAEYYKNLYEALLKQGFTKEQALQIVIAQGSILSSSNK